MKAVSVWVTVLGFALSIYGPVGIAKADSDRMTDPNDARGRLDIASISHGHADDRIRHRLRTQEGWTQDGMGRRSHILVWISTDRDQESERRISIVRQGGRLHAEMEVYSAEGDSAGVRPLAEVPVNKPDRRTVVVLFRPRLLGREVDRYRWSATTAYQKRGNKHCSERMCHDDFVDERELTHHL